MWVGGYSVLYTCESFGFSVKARFYLVFFILAGCACMEAQPQKIDGARQSLRANKDFGDLGDSSGERGEE
jgi:hypothetical protein